MSTTTKGSAVVTLPNDTDILVTREFNAPADVVWRVFTEPELIARWWAGRQGTVTSVEIDPRPGGTYRYVMAPAEGGEIAFHGEIRAAEPGRLLVHTEVFEGMPDAEGNATLNTYTFTERDGVTTLELVTRAPSTEVRDAIVASGMEVGMQESYDLLEEIAAGLTAK